MSPLNAEPTNIGKQATTRMADSKAPTVIVIGSGFAGLGAARILQDAGIKVSDLLTNPIHPSR